MSEEYWHTLREVGPGFCGLRVEREASQSAAYVCVVWLYLVKLDCIIFLSISVYSIRFYSVLFYQASTE